MTSFHYYYKNPLGFNFLEQIERRSVTSRYHGSTISGWQQNQRRRRQQGERQTNNGCLPFTRIFREIRFERKWNTTFWVFPTENFREQQNIWKGSPVFPDEIFLTEIRVPFPQPSLIPVWGLRVLIFRVTALCRLSSLNWRYQICLAKKVSALFVYRRFPRKYGMRFLFLTNAKRPLTV